MVEVISVREYFGAGDAGLSVVAVVELPPHAVTEVITSAMSVAITVPRASPKPHA